jgi:hypothetical protein
MGHEWGMHGTDKFLLGVQGNHNVQVLLAGHQLQLKSDSFAEDKNNSSSSNTTNNDMTSSTKNSNSSNSNCSSSSRNSSTPINSSSSSGDRSSCKHGSTSSSRASGKSGYRVLKHHQAWDVLLSWRDEMDVLVVDHWRNGTFLLLVDSDKAPDGQLVAVTLGHRCHQQHQQEKEEEQEKGEQQQQQEQEEREAQQEGTRDAYGAGLVSKSQP